MAVRIGATKISNSHRGVVFDITKRDIENGQPNDPCACAAARALKRQFDAKETFVFRDVTYILKKNGEAMRYHTSSALRLETIVFDRNGEFYPGSYALEPAPLTVKTKNKPGANTKRGHNRKPRERYAIPNVRPTASQRLPRV